MQTSTVTYELLKEYVALSEHAADVDYSNPQSVRRLNMLSERMRSIVIEVVTMGSDAVIVFAEVLEKEPAAVWAAHHLVELSSLAPEVRARCFKRVERAMEQAEEMGDLANAMGEEMWLKEWRFKMNEK